MFFLYLTDLATGVENDHIHTFNSQESAGNGTAGIAGSGTDYVHLAAGLLQDICKGVAEKLQGHILKGQGGAMEKLQRMEDIYSNESDIPTAFDAMHEELKTRARVEENGSIEFPLVGSVQVGALKISSAAKKIEKLLADGYIINPQVQIYIEEFKSKKVIILGQVQSPGIIELRGPLSLLELLSKAGGLQDDVGETVTITRNSNGRKRNSTFNLKKLIESGGGGDNIEVLDGDTVSVSKKVDELSDDSVCYITGQVNKPGAYSCDTKTTVLKMVSLAGSFTGIAAESSIRINRVVNGKKQVLEDVSPDTSVLPDDVIEVPESFF